MESATKTAIPPDLQSALSEVPEAERAWQGLTDIGRRDFIGWINQAKQESTRAKRIRVCIDKLLKGEKRPCCYAVVPMDLYRALGDEPDAKEQWSQLSANEKRDFSDWVENAPGKADRKDRVLRALAALKKGEKSVP